MKKNSLVKYIGGQDKFSKKFWPLNPEEVYTVKELCEANFTTKSGKEWRKAVKLAEMKVIAFDRTMFVEVKAPVEIDLKDVYNDTHYSILNNLN